VFQWHIERVRLYLSVEFDSSGCQEEVFTTCPEFVRSPLAPADRQSVDNYGMDAMPTALLDITEKSVAASSAVATLALELEYSTLVAAGGVSSLQSFCSSAGECIWMNFSSL